MPVIGSFAGSLDSKQVHFSFPGRNDMGEINGIKSLGVALLMAGMVTHAGTLAAQEVKHLNPVIEKLAAGKAVIGFQTGDLTLGNARTMSRADADYV
jgi:hypothetical protein